MRCRERDYSFDSHVSVFMYRGMVKEMLQAYKFERRRELAGTFTCFVAGLLHERALENTVLVPSPPRSSAKRIRGWEHVQEIVSTLERDYHIPVLRLLSRRGGKTQKRLDYQGRRENIRGKIAARTGVRIPSHLLFFDDVFTTGSTADECATVLKKLGAERVDVVTVAMD
jgi:ComF family protein